MIHLWSHDIGAISGGVQSYTLAVVRALESLVGPEAVKVSLKHERVRPPQLSGQIALRRYGFVPAKLRTAAFAAGAVAWALQDRPPLIFSCHPNFAPVGVRLGRWTRSRFWTAAHGIDVWEDCPPAVVRALQRADHVLAVSEFTKRKMVQGHGVPGEKISVLPNTFDARRFCPGEVDPSVRDEFKLPQAGKLLLSVGRLAEPSRMKGFDRVIEAMPRILEAVPEARYVIGGTGPDRARLEGLARECGVREQVIFAGFVPDDRLAALYRSCDAFVMPSKKEGFGIVFLEALACGLPVVAGNVDASGEALLRGELGMLVDPDAVGEIAAACVRLLTRRIEDHAFLDPSRLSSRVTEAFGPEAFRAALRRLLDAHAPAVFLGEHGWSEAQAGRRASQAE